MQILNLKILLVLDSVWLQIQSGKIYILLLQIIIYVAVSLLLIVYILMERLILFKCPSENLKKTINIFYSRVQIILSTWYTDTNILYDFISTKLLNYINFVVRILLGSCGLSIVLYWHSFLQIMHSSHIIIIYTRILLSLSFFPVVCIYRWKLITRIYLRDYKNIYKIVYIKFFIP